MNENHESHKDHFVVSVSAMSGSRHFTLKRPAQRAWLAALSLLAVVFVVSLTANYFHRERVEILTAKNARLDNERERLSKHTERLNQEIAAQAEVTRTLQRDLIEIERLLGLHHPPVSGKRKGLVARVDMAKLSANQEKILHRSIPNGFPTSIYTITSEYGMRRHPVTGRKSFHKGVDLRTNGKVNVYATADGIVRRAEKTRLSGLLVVVQHNFGFESYYAHLSDINVHPGEIIQRGELIGISGNSGRHSNGPHLHYEVRYLGKPINPFEFLHWELGSHKIFAKVKGVQWPSLINLVHKQIMRQTLRLSQQDPVSPAASK
ncbi:MAG: M23 family metallopeptidase [Gammaproteobacteria bacterium]